MMEEDNAEFFSRGVSFPALEVSSIPEEIAVLDDLKLIQQALAGDIDSFGRIVNRHRGA